MGLARGRGVESQDDAPRSRVRGADDRAEDAGHRGPLGREALDRVLTASKFDDDRPRVHRGVVAQTRQVRRERALLTDHQGRKLHEELRALPPQRRDLGRAVVIAATVALIIVFARACFLVPVLAVPVLVAVGVVSLFVVRVIVAALAGARGQHQGEAEEGRETSCDHGGTPMPRLRSSAMAARRASHCRSIRAS